MFPDVSQLEKLQSMKFLPPPKKAHTYGSQHFTEHTAKSQTPSFSSGSLNTCRRSGAVGVLLSFQVHGRKCGSLHCRLGSGRGRHGSRGSWNWKHGTCTQVPGKVRGRLFPEERTACTMVWVRERWGWLLISLWWSAGQTWKAGPNGEGLC